MKLTTTLNRIWCYYPCNRKPDNPRDTGWNRLIDYLGHDFDHDTEINLLTILESNGVQDCLWTLRATIQDSRKIAVQLAVEFAKRVLDIFESEYPCDDRPRKAIEAGESWLRESNEKNRAKAAKAAHAAAKAASMTYKIYMMTDAIHAAEAAKAAYAAAKAAVSAMISMNTTSVVSYTVADAVADAAANAAEQDAQVEIIKRYLTE